MHSKNNNSEGAHLTAQNERGIIKRHYKEKKLLPDSLFDESVENSCPWVLTFKFPVVYVRSKG